MWLSTFPSVTKTLYIVCIIHIYCTITAINVKKKYLVKINKIVKNFLNFLNIFEKPVKNITEKGVEKMFDKICLALIIIGALNWGLVGIFQFDLVAWLFGGSAALLSRIVYTVIALAGIWCISLLFRRNHEV